MSELKSWPDLVGLTGEEAKKRILSQQPELKVHILEPGSCYTADFRKDRVRIHVDEQGKVQNPPRIG